MRDLLRDRVVTEAIWVEGHFKGKLSTHLYGKIVENGDLLIAEGYRSQDTERREKATMLGMVMALMTDYRSDETMGWYVLLDGELRLLEDVTSSMMCETHKGDLAEVMGWLMFLGEMSKYEAVFPWSYYAPKYKAVLPWGQVLELQYEKSEEGGAQ